MKPHAMSDKKENFKQKKIEIGNKMQKNRNTKKELI